MLSSRAFDHVRSVEIARRDKRRGYFRAAETRGRYHELARLIGRGLHRERIISGHSGWLSRSRKRK